MQNFWNAFNEVNKRQSISRMKSTHFSASREWPNLELQESDSLLNDGIVEYLETLNCVSALQSLKTRFNAEQTKAVRFRLAEADLKCD